MVSKLCKTNINFSYNLHSFATIYIMNEKIQRLKQELAKQIIGQSEMIDALLIALLSEGHILLEGLPGLAKTTAVHALASAVHLQFQRIQFTPDLLPSDILGAEIYDLKSGDFKIKKGPIFTNFLLADEINRAPAKIQSALLEVMQERQVTIGDTSFQVPAPFLVLATQNPIDQEGAYKLPQAQLDRFMFKIIIGYNSQEEELEIASRATEGGFEKIDTIFTVEELEQMKERVRAVHIDKELKVYIIQLIFTTREKHKYIKFGASPRASIDMMKAVKARAFLRGNDFVSPSDIVLCAKDILRHRIVLSYDALVDGVSADTIIQEILENTLVP